MAKSTRRKKQDRRQRERRQAAIGRQRARDELIAATVARMDEAFDRLAAADTPPPEVADLLIEIWGESDVPRRAMLGNLIPGGADRLAGVAEAVRKRAPGSTLTQVMTVELRGLVYQDRAAALHDLAELLPQLPPQVRVNAARRAIDLGRPDLALTMARDILAATAGWGDDAGPADPDSAQRDEATAMAAEQLLAAAVQAPSEPQDRPSADEAGDDSPSPAEIFRNATVLQDFEDAWTRWLGRNPAAGAVIDRRVAELHEELPEDAGEVISIDGAKSLARCHAMLLSIADEDEADDGRDDGSDSGVQVFARDPSTPAALAATARKWSETIHFGVWQLEEPAPELAGSHLLDLITGIEHFVPLDLASVGPVGRWSALLGALVCVDGVWRTAAPMLPLSPVEGDAIAELVERMSTAVTSELLGRGWRDSANWPAPFGSAPPHGVEAPDQDPVSLVTARVISMVAGAGLTRLLSEVAEYRLRTPRLQNTDGDPMILVKAKLSVADLDHVLARLRTHRDITPDDEATGTFTWWGRKLTDAERKPLLAEAAVQLGVDPSEVVEDPGGQRWARGRVSSTGGQLELDVNSVERLDRFCDLLRGLGAEPEVMSMSTVDPAQDMVLPRGPALPATLSPQASALWAEHWLDEKVPALSGKTPRQAAASEKRRPQLEALLRQFEWLDDMRRQRHPSAPRGAEIGWLREQLGMELPE